MEEYSPVVVIGAATMDTKGRAAVALRRGTSCEGDIRISAGGVARNIAENLGRLGVPTTLLTAVGSDELGTRILAAAAESGVSTDHAVITDEHRTGAYMAIYDARGEMAYSIHDMEIVRLITPEYVYRKRGLLARASLVAIDANLPPRTLRTLFSVTRKYGIRVCADTTTVALSQRLKPYLPDLYMVTPNAAEAAALTGLEVADKAQSLVAARRLVSMGVQVAIVTLGEEGLCYASPESSGTLPAIQCDIVDLTGAGDALTAAVVFGLLNDMDVDDAVRLGLAAAALTIQCRETVCPDLSVDLLYDQMIV